MKIYPENKRLLYMRVRRIIPSIRKEEDRLIIHAYNDGNISFDSPEEEELFLKEMGIRKRG